MKRLGWFSRRPEKQPCGAWIARMDAGFGLAGLLLMTGMAVAQNPTENVGIPAPAQMSVPNGYTAHHSVDVGGRMSKLSGSQAMYDTMVNLQSGPRVLGESFEMRALPGKKNAPVDYLKAFGSGFGGDPYNLATLNASKGKLYDFTGMFRRDRQYFDYDLLGNPNVPGGQSIPVSGSNTPFAWSQVNQSPFLFNTVRRMTDTNLALTPLAKVSYRLGYSQNIMQGPSLTPSGYQVGGSYAIVVQEYQRNSTDDFFGAIDWKPVEGTKLTFEGQIDHYKGDSSFTAVPSSFNVQEADGTPVALLASYFNLTPYAASSCNANSAGGTPLLSAQAGAALPVVNPACAVLTSYSRLQPTRMLYPTGIFRLQSSSIRNLTMNGNVRYTLANMSLPTYIDNFQGLTVAGKTGGAIRSQLLTATARAHRDVMAADYGVAWQATKKLTLEEQINYWSVQQPGSATFTSGTTIATPGTAGNETINATGLTTTNAAAGASTLEGSGAIGTPLPDYFGQRFLINNLTASWAATPRTLLSLTYRYRTHLIGEGIPHNAPLAAGATTNGTVTINENGGIFNAALRPTDKLNINGTVEVLYDDNAFTPMGPRQTKHYRMHTLYKPKTWATVSGAFNDLELHNNTNNTGATPVDGPLQHTAHTRVASVGTSLAPNEHWGLDVNYAYSDVYMAGNICYDAAASATLPGAAPPSGSLCPGATVRGTNYYEFGPVRDYMDAPTQNGQIAVNASPTDSVHYSIGYQVSAVSGSRFYNDARDVAGSLMSTYQTPFIKASYTVHPGLAFNAQWDYFGYTEGGASGAAYCSTSNPTSANPVVPVVPCNSPSLAGLQTGLTLPNSGETAPRTFRTDNVVLGVHYEF